MAGQLLQALDLTVVADTNEQDSQATERVIWF
jgi:hypothetical protein